MDKYYTFIQFKNPVDTKTYFWEGEINQQTMMDEGLYDPASVLSKWNKHLDIVNLGQTVTRIGTGTFESCEFSKMTIQRNVEFIGASAFNSTAGEVVFKDRTLAEVQAMANYPWDLNPSQIKTWNAASQEWVLEQLSALEARIAALEGN